MCGEGGPLRRGAAQVSRSIEQLSFQCNGLAVGLWVSCGQTASVRAQSFAAQLDDGVGRNPYVALCTPSMEYRWKGSLETLSVDSLSMRVKGVPL